MIPSLSGVVSIAAGLSHSVATTEEGDVWTWGHNANGQLGDNTQTDSNVPVLAAAGGASYLENISYLSAGAEHSLAATQSGTVLAWGDNASGQLGVTGLAHSELPVAAPGLTNVTKVAAGQGFSLALKSDGTVVSVKIHTTV